MTNKTVKLGRCAGRAGALVATALVLLACVDFSAPPPPLVLEAVTSCGPAATITIESPDAAAGCGGDESRRAVGGPEAGLPGWAVDDEDDALVFAGPVTIPGSDPPLTVRRTCGAAAPVDGVRALSCEGDAPEAACSGTLTERPAAGIAP